MAIRKTERSGEYSTALVIGGSAGGLTALITLVESFKLSWNIPVFVVLHLSQQSVGNYIATRLSAHTPYNCKLAEDNEPVKKNHIYIAPPNRHLLIDNGTVILGSGPEENRWRPSIDVLFRSAATQKHLHVIGIILSGLLDDGTSGMTAIKKSGGTCIVQNPEEAEYPDMPRSALNAVRTSHCVKLSAMPGIIDKTLRSPKRPKKRIPPEVLVESAISKNVSTGYKDLKKISTQTVYNCPDCGGGLWEIKEGKLSRYRCHIGHVYSEQDLLLKQNETTETTLWVALRLMEERKTLMTKMLDEQKNRGLLKTMHVYEKKITDLSTHIIQMKELLSDLQKE
jgi:two-component system chemotaxis response regulator CheB